jgi:sugar/nucleoside kinase (ribokinase family)
MAKPYDVLVVGSYSIDLVFTGLPHMPPLGMEVLASGFEMLPGEAYTGAVAMHRLGLQVGWAGDFGNDSFSRFALECARKEGLDERLFVHHKRPLRRISVAASFPQDRAFLTYYDPDPRLPAAVKALTITAARLLYVPGFFCGPLFDGGVKLARARGMRIVMDANTGGSISLSEDEEGIFTAQAVRHAVQSVDLLLANAREARCLTGEEDLEKAIWVLGEHCPLVVVKDGANGAYAWQAGTRLHAPTLPVQPLDTTGAGDCFNAGFIKAWLDGLSLEECLRWGNVVGALSTLARGGTGRMITTEEVRRKLKDLPV